ncbi:type III pantothenate kinase [Allorhodopirellula heiligendammensis]|uniref:Type III pantothenate kinase n=1 Tax=Allorhodopirellula heiligendammensis TaxID=2714739 RepID=A0A5C6BDV0_9BACT|nr:type III pantothenate kinase [Allorhodopirellula heiligendammensis]TWU10218.1 Type III pantothenate kinase [Allorhodopirellula heiligendammensis]
MIIGIDVGNTAIKLAFAHESEAIVKRVSDPEAIESLSQTLWAASRSEPADIRIASVNRTKTHELIERTQTKAGTNTAFRQITHTDLPLAVETDSPERVGIDRLVGCYGAAKVYRLPLVVVDAGTTVTVDLVDSEGIYRGGAIIPGLEMQTRALAAGTDALPHIDWQDSCESASLAAPHCVPAKDTISAIRLGILSSVVGGIERLVRLYGNPSCVVVTGGDCQCIAAALQISSQHDFNTHLHPHLVCRTLASLG